MAPFNFGYLLGGGGISSCSASEFHGHQGGLRSRNTGGGWRRTVNSSLWQLQTGCNTLIYDFGWLLLAVSCLSFRSISNRMNDCFREKRSFNPL